MKGNSRPKESLKKKKELISIFEDVMNEAKNYSNLKNKLKYKLGANAIRAPLLFDVDTLKKISDNVKNLDQLVKSNTQDKHNLRRSHRTTCPPDYTNGQNDNVGQDSDQDYHQDSDSNDEDPDYQANSPESIDNDDMNYNGDEMEQDQDQDQDQEMEMEIEHEEEDEDEHESDININENQKPTVNDLDYALNKNNYDNNDQVPSTSRNDNMNNDFDYLPHIKMEKFTYVSDSSDESINFDDYRL